MHSHTQNPSVQLKDGVYKGILKDVRIQAFQDLEDEKETVQTIYFDIVLEENDGSEMCISKVYNIVSKSARNCLRGELEVLGFEVHDRNGLLSVLDELKGLDVFVRVITKEGVGHDTNQPSAVKQYTFVPKPKSLAEIYGTFNPRVGW